MSKKTSLNCQFSTKIRKHFTPGIKKENRERYDFGSYQTFYTYRQQAKSFADFCKRTYGFHTVDECRTVAAEYLYNLASEVYSPRTIKTAVAALNCVYNTRNGEILSEVKERYFQNSDFAFYQAFSFNRGCVKRSTNYYQDRVDYTRGLAAKIKEISLAFGFRRAELETITPSNFIYDSAGNIIGAKLFNKNDAKKENIGYVHTKGGRSRYAEMLPNEEAQKILKELIAQCPSPKTPIVSLLTESGSCKLSSRYDIHGFRHIYAENLYKKYARPISTIRDERIKSHNYNSKKDYSRSHHCTNDGTVSAVYRARTDKGIVELDRMALRYVSANLGHSRESVVLAYLKFS